MCPIASSPSIFWPVRPVWQLDPLHPIPEKERRTSCAVATAKMLLDHLRPDCGPDFPFHVVRDCLLLAGGKDTVGHWRHAAQVRFLSSLGLVAWRRNWDAPTQDPQWLADHEAYSPEQLSAIRSQIAAESALIPADRPWHSLKAALLASGPVIASVRPGFTSNRQNHQVLIHGCRDDGQTEILAFVDPLAAPDPAAAHEMELPRFLAFFNQRAVFARRPEPAGCPAGTSTP